MIIYIYIYIYIHNYINVHIYVHIYIYCIHPVCTSHKSHWSHVRTWGGPTWEIPWPHELSPFQSFHQDPVQAQLGYYTDMHEESRQLSGFFLQRSLAKSNMNIYICIYIYIWIYIYIYIYESPKMAANPKIMSTHGVKFCVVWNHCTSRSFRLPTGSTG